MDIEVIEGGGGGRFFRTALLKWRADILHFHWLHPYLLRESGLKTIYASLRFLTEVTLLRSSGSRIVWTIHNLKNHDNRFVKLERLFLKAFSKLCSRFIVHSEQAKKLALDAFSISDERRIYVIPHGNYIKHYPNKITNSQAREVLGIGKNHFVLLFLGRIHPYKGVIDLIHSFKAIASDAILIIAGKPVDDEASHCINHEVNGISNIIYRPGYVPDDQVQVYMNACDVVIFPYRDILTSGSIALAMSFGRACLVPRISTLTDVLNDSGAIFFDPNSRDTLKIALEKACAVKSKTAEMGAYNLQFAEQCNWEKIGIMIQGVYDSCLAS